MAPRFSISFSSWNYDLSSCVTCLLEEVERAPSKTPVVDVIYAYLARQVGGIWGTKD